MRREKGATQELLHASFRGDGTVAVNVGGNSRRFLTSIAGFHEGLGEIIPNIDRRGNDYGFNGCIDLIKSHGILIAQRLGGIKLAQIFPPTQVEFLLRFRISPAGADTTVGNIRNLGVLIRESREDDANNVGLVWLSMVLRVKVPMRIWVAQFIRGKFQKQTLSYLYLLGGRPQKMETITTHTHRWTASNVHADGHICWGHAELTQPLTSLDAVDQFFLTSPFNLDLQDHWRWADLSEEYLNDPNIEHKPEVVGEEEERALQLALGPRIGFGF